MVIIHGTYMDIIWKYDDYPMVEGIYQFWPWKNGWPKLSRTSTNFLGVSLHSNPLCHIYTYIYMYICIHVNMSICIYVYMYVYICVYMYICIYTHRVRFAVGKLANNVYIYITLNDLDECHEQKKWVIAIRLQADQKVVRNHSDPARSWSFSGSILLVKGIVPSGFIWITLLESPSFTQVHRCLIGFDPIPMCL